MEITMFKTVNHLHMDHTQHIATGNFWTYPASWRLFGYWMVTFLLPLVNSQWFLHKFLASTTSGSQPMKWHWPLRFPQVNKHSTDRCGTPAIWLAMLASLWVRPTTWPRLQNPVLPLIWLRVLPFVLVGPLLVCWRWNQQWRHWFWEFFRPWNSFFDDNIGQ